MVTDPAGSAQAARGGRLPDFLLVGAPKAGTTALHAALAQHPELFLSPVKEPKYYLCGDSPPPAYRGPGDAHSNREWIWQRQRYLDLFADAGDDQLAGESTPFYLYHRDARRRIAADLPRGPARRACCATRSTGPTPTGCTCGPTASSRARTSSRPAGGRRSASTTAGRRSGTTAGSGCTAASSPTSSSTSRASRCCVLRYRAARRRPARHPQPGVPVPRRRRGRGHRDPGRQLAAVRAPQRAHPGARPGGARRCGGRPVPAAAGLAHGRAGRSIGQLHQRGNPARPRLTPEQRDALREPFLEDIDLLEQVTGESYDDWRAHRDGDSFHTRQSQRECRHGG